MSTAWVDVDRIKMKANKQMKQKHSPSQDILRFWPSPSPIIISMQPVPVPTATHGQHWHWRTAKGGLKTLQCHQKRSRH